jgi:hypothetical protein
MTAQKRTVKLLTEKAATQLLITIAKITIDIYTKGAINAILRRAQINTKTLNNAKKDT